MKGGSIKDPPPLNKSFSHQCLAGRVFQYRVGSGCVLDKIPGIGSGLGRVGVSKYTIWYFRVSFLLLGISGYFGYPLGTAWGRRRRVGGDGSFGDMCVKVKVVSD